MALPSDIHPFHLAGAGQGYQVANSLRFRASNSAFLSRTPGSAGNRKTWTLSFWTKLGNRDSNFVVMTAGYVSNPISEISFGVDGFGITTYDGNYYSITVPTIKYRDHSAWYHLLLSSDTTQANQSNRGKIFVNGIQRSTGTNFPLNYDHYFNATVTHYIGNKLNYPNQQFYDGYMAEINFIDGLQLDASYFGMSDSVTGQWIPKKYIGSYGTNGFYLPFNDATSTTTLGYDRQLSPTDSSKNNWTVNNFSVTSGITYDLMKDSPTNYNDGGLNRGNYATLNPAATSSTLTLSNGNLSVTMNSTNANCVAPSTLAIPVGQKGKYYWEMFCSAQTGDNNFGLVNENYNFLTDRFDIYNSSANSLSWYGAQSGGVFLGNTRVATLVDWSASGASWVACAVDGETGKIWFALNGTWQGSGDPGSGVNPAYTWSSSKLLFPAFRPYTGGGAVYSVNFGQRPFNYTPPSGFTALNTYNLPNPSLPLV